MCYSTLERGPSRHRPCFYSFTLPPPVNYFLLDCALAFVVLFVHLHVSPWAISCSFPALPHLAGIKMEKMHKHNSFFDTRIRYNGGSLLYGVSTLVVGRIPVVECCRFALKALSPATAHVPI
eukprot:Hpha_TRINITY_DN15979_c4_g3::TRINITY_DN15979_c4_g3_i1::g.73358::m.73358